MQSRVGVPSPGKEVASLLLISPSMRSLFLPHHFIIICSYHFILISSSVTIQTPFLPHLPILSSLFPQNFHFFFSSLHPHFLIISSPFNHHTIIISSSHITKPLLLKKKKLNHRNPLTFTSQSGVFQNGNGRIHGGRHVSTTSYEQVDLPILYPPPPHHPYYENHPRPHHQAPLLDVVDIQADRSEAPDTERTADRMSVRSATMSLYQVFAPPRHEQLICVLSSSAFFSPPFSRWKSTST